MAVDPESVARRTRAAVGADDMLRAAGFTPDDAARVSSQLLVDDDRLVVVVLPWAPEAREPVEVGDRVAIAGTEGMGDLTLLVQQVAYAATRTRVGIAAAQVDADGEPDWRIEDATGMPT